MRFGVSLISHDRLFDGAPGLEFIRYRRRIAFRMARPGFVPRGLYLPNPLKFTDRSSPRYPPVAIRENDLTLLVRIRRYDDDGCPGHRGQGGCQVRHYAGRQARGQGG
jgi:hypothetical protein